MEETKLTSSELLEMTEKEFHDNNSLWHEIASTYSNASLKVFDDTIKFVYQALTAMGIIAGFGFAGIQGVQNLYLFFLGELAMFGAMIFGIYNIKRIYINNASSLDDMSMKVRNVYEKRAIVLSEIMNDIRKNGRVKNQSYLERYKKSTDEISEIFGVGKKAVKQKDESGFITWMIFFFIFGFVFLLTAYLPLISTNDNVRFHSRGFNLYKSSFSNHKPLPTGFSHP